MFRAFFVSWVVTISSQDIVFKYFFYIIEWKYCLTELRYSNGMTDPATKRMLSPKRFWFLYGSRGENIRYYNLKFSVEVKGQYCLKIASTFLLFCHTMRAYSYVWQDKAFIAYLILFLVSKAFLVVSYFNYNNLLEFRLILKKLLWFINKIKSVWNQQP